MFCPPLKLLQIDLTEECPLLCAHCSNRSGPNRSQSFPIDVLVRIVRESHELGTERVVYSGGEPLRYTHLPEALAATKAAQINTTIFTTGIRDLLTRLPISDEEWSRLRGDGLSGARFSVYSSPKNREFHNKIVRMAPLVGDAFGVNENAVSAAGRLGIDVEIHFVPADETAGELHEVYRWAEDIGCRRLHLQAPTVQGRNAETCSLTLSQAGELQLQVAALQLQRRSDGMEFYISRFWRQAWGLLDADGCAAAEEQLIIRSDGTLSPCNACKYASASDMRENILSSDASLTHLWQESQLLKEIREARRSGTTPSGCMGVLATSFDRNLRNRPLTT